MLPPPSGRDGPDHLCPAPVRARALAAGAKLFAFGPVAYRMAGRLRQRFSTTISSLRGPAWWKVWRKRGRLRAQACVPPSGPCKLGRAATAVNLDVEIVQKKLKGKRRYIGGEKIKITNIGAVGNSRGSRLIAWKRIRSKALSIHPRSETEITHDSYLSYQMQQM